MKTSRVRTNICREGWYYLFVVLFIVGGAVLREVNLLVALAGLMIAPFLLNWRMAVASVSQLQVRRRRPARGFAGQPVRVELTVHNPRWRLAAWLVRVTDEVQRLGDGRSGRARAEMLLPHVIAGSSEAISYRLLPQDRGRHRLGPLTLSVRYPFGLLQARRSFRQIQQFIVWPRIGRLKPHWNQLACGALTGPQSSRAMRRADGEFYALRPWLPGDSRRQVHWRTTARVGAPVVKQHEHLGRPDISLALDLWTDANPSELQLERVEAAVSLAATLVADICRAGGSRLSLTLPGEPPRVFRAVANRHYGEQLLDELAIVEGGPVHCANTMQAAEQADPQTPLLIISTRAEPPAEAAQPGKAAPRDDGRRRRWIEIGSPSAEAIYEGP